MKSEYIFLSLLRMFLFVILAYNPIAQAQDFVCSPSADYSVNPSYLLQGFDGGFPKYVQKSFLDFKNILGNESSNKNEYLVNHYAKAVTPMNGSQSVMTRLNTYKYSGESSNTPTHLRYDFPLGLVEDYGHIALEIRRRDVSSRVRRFSHKCSKEQHQARVGFLENEDRLEYMVNKRISVFELESIAYIQYCCDEI